jgi:hypothetical protein
LVSLEIVFSKLRTAQKYSRVQSIDRCRPPISRVLADTKLRPEKNTTSRCHHPDETVSGQSSGS